MRETSKSLPLRQQHNHFNLYLHGHGIDIGCGPDILQIPSGTVEPFDKQHGDAQLLKTLPNNKYDFVYSSHCLEHMHSVPIALHNWCRVLKPGGFLFILVPDFKLYEHCIWPSLFNSDHKATFSRTIKREQNDTVFADRFNHFHIDDHIAPILKKHHVRMVNCGIEDLGYDDNKNSLLYDQTLHGALAQIRIIAQKEK